MALYPTSYQPWPLRYDYTTVVFAEHFNTAQDELTTTQRIVGLTPQISRRDPGSTPIEILPVVTWVSGAPIDQRTQLAQIMEDSGPVKHGYVYGNVLAECSALVGAPPVQTAQWVSTSRPTALRTMATRLRDAGENSCPPAQVSGWVDDVRNYPRQGGTTSTYRPPQVGPRDHVTVAKRLDFQGRGLHLPYYRGAAYSQAVSSNEWTNASLTGYDDPFQLASGQGLTLNQSGIWAVQVKTDWSVYMENLVVESARATRLQINGRDVGLRDYLDDDAYTAKDSINTFVWMDLIPAGSTLTVGLRAEGGPDQVAMKANVYVRVYLVRCMDGAFDMTCFPLPIDVDVPVVEPAHEVIGGYYDHFAAVNPVKPATSSPCHADDLRYVFTYNSSGQAGSYKCDESGNTVVSWSAYAWDGGQYWSGGTVGGPGAQSGGPGPYPGSW